MNAERFQRMIEAYGADPARWPHALRADGLWFLAQTPDRERLVEAEQALDAQIDAWRLDSPSVALRERITAPATTCRAARPAWRSRRLWLSGAGLAAACAAGVIAGVNVGAAWTLLGPSSSDRDAEALVGNLDSVAVFGSRLDPEASL
jgi:hypothetical protein